MRPWGVDSYRDACREAAVHQVEHVDLAVVTAAQPELRAVEGDVALIGTAASRTGQSSTIVRV